MSTKSGTMRRITLLILALAAAAALSLEVAPGTSAAQEKGSLSAQLKNLTPRQQLNLLEKLEAEGRNDAKIPFYKGNAMYALGKLDSATILFQESASRDSMFSKAFVNLGLALDAQGQFFGAELAFKSALRADPNDVLAYCHLGFLYYSKQKYPQAIQRYKEALAIDPKSAQAHYYLGLAFADTRIFREALKEWELVARLDPEGELGKTARENVGLIKQYLEMQAP